jgi:holo-[acyl-carrier protein] synthase
VNDFFIGTDIVAVSRVADLLDSALGLRFKKRVFTPAEIAYCERKGNPAVHFAGRFAAKEAIKKALLSSQLVSNIPWIQMEILADHNGAPHVTIHRALERCRSCQVSISHTAENAVAVALLQIAPCAS